jgi:hypothetical protein
VGRAACSSAYARRLGYIACTGILMITQGCSMTDFRKTAYSAVMEYGCLEMQSNRPDQQGHRSNCMSGLAQGMPSFEQYESMRLSLDQNATSSYIAPPSFSYHP